jgi:hypothetical protein
VEFLLTKRLRENHGKDGLGLYHLNQRRIAVTPDVLQFAERHGKAVRCARRALEEGAVNSDSRTFFLVHFHFVAVCEE